MDFGGFREQYLQWYNDDSFRKFITPYPIGVQRGAKLTQIWKSLVFLQNRVLLVNCLITFYDLLKFEYIYIIF